MPRPGFYNDNANRAYPLQFCPGVMLRTCDGLLLEIPDSVFVDMGILMGLDSGFVAGQHTVYLHAICRANDVFGFEFRSSAPGTFGSALYFLRHIDDERYLLEDSEDRPSGGLECPEEGIAFWLLESLESGDYWETESADPGPWLLESSDSSAASIQIPSDVSTASSGCPDEPIWSGYLVTGSLEDLAEIIPDGCGLLAADEDVPVEPALIRSLVNHYARTLNLANDDRTRADAPDGCPELDYPFATGQTYVQADCLVEDVKLKAGYNTTIFQDDFDNSITIGASVGAGEGEPCEEVALFAGEQSPTGRSTLDGALLCNEVLRSVNGIGGRYLNISAGKGISIEDDAAHNRLVVDVNMRGLAVCFPNQSDDLDASFESC